MRRKPFRFIGLIVIYVTARASLLQLLLRRFPLFFPSRLPFRPVSPMEYTGNTWRWRRNDRSEFLFILHRVTVLSAGSREQEQHKRIPRFRNRPSIRESFLSRETMFVVLNDKRGGERENTVLLLEMSMLDVWLNLKWTEPRWKKIEIIWNFWRKLIRYLKHW